MIKNILLLLLIITFLAAGQIKTFLPFIWIFNSVNLAIIALVLASHFLKVKIKNGYITLALIVLITSYVTAASLIIKSRSEINLMEPIDKSYRSDEMIFLKTYYLTKMGSSYYSAFQSAYSLDFRFQHAPGDVFAWRTPVVFYLWKLIAASGEEIRILFVIFSASSLVAAYLISAKFTNFKIALFSCYLLIPYFLDALGETFFLFTEWWALFFFIFGLACYFYNRKNLAYLFLVICVLTRELFIFPVLFIFLARLFKKDYSPIIPLALISIFYLIHAKYVIQATNQTQFNISGRLHPFSKELLLNVLAHSTRIYYWSIARIGTFFAPVAMVGLLITFLKKERNFSQIAIATSSFALLLGLSPFLGTADFTSRTFSDYWGITFMPLAIIFAPTIFNFFNSGKKRDTK